MSAFWDQVSSIPPWASFIAVAIVIFLNFPEVVLKLIFRVFAGVGSFTSVGIVENDLNYEAIAEKLAERLKPKHKSKTALQVFGGILVWVATILTIIVCTIQLLIWETFSQQKRLLRV